MERIFEGYVFDFEGLDSQLDYEFKEIVQMLGAKVSKDAPYTFMEMNVYISNSQAVQNRINLYNLNYLLNSVEAGIALDIKSYRFKPDKKHNDYDKPACYMAKYVYHTYSCHRYYYENYFCEKCATENIADSKTPNTITNGRYENSARKSSSIQSNELQNNTVKKGHLKKKEFLEKRADELHLERTSNDEDEISEMSDTAYNNSEQKRKAEKNHFQKKSGDDKENHKDKYKDESLIRKSHGEIKKFKIQSKRGTSEEITKEEKEYTRRKEVVQKDHSRESDSDQDSDINESPRQNKNHRQKQMTDVYENHVNLNKSSSDEIKNSQESPNLGRMRKMKSKLKKTEEPMDTNFVENVNRDGNFEVVDHEFAPPVPPVGPSSWINIDNLPVVKTEKKEVKLSLSDVSDTSYDSDVEIDDNRKNWWINREIPPERLCSIPHCKLEPYKHEKHDRISRVINMAEKRVLLKYLIMNKEIKKSKGSKVYKDMIALGYLKNRSDETLRNCFRRKILPNIETFNLPQEIVEEFKSLR